MGNKITTHGGPSEEPKPAFTPIRRAMLGGEPKSVGNSSETSIETEQKTSATEKVSPPQPAPMMESPSKKATPPVLSTARTMGGSGRPEKPSAKKGKPAAKKTSTKANVRSMDDFD